MQFMITVIIISISSGFDSAIIIVRATSVWSSIVFHHQQIVLHFYPENTKTLLQQFFYFHPRSYDSLLQNIRYLSITERTCLLSNEFYVRFIICITSPSCAIRLLFTAYPLNIYCLKKEFAHLRNSTPRLDLTRYPTEIITSRL